MAWRILLSALLSNGCAVAYFSLLKVARDSVRDLDDSSEIAFSNSIACKVDTNSTTILKSNRENLSNL